MRIYKTESELRELTDELWEAGYPITLTAPDLQILTQYDRQRIKSNNDSNIKKGRKSDLQNLTKRQAVGVIGEFAIAKYLFEHGIKYKWDGSYNEDNADMKIIHPDGTMYDIGIKTLVYDPGGPYLNTYQIRTAESANRPHIPQAFVMLKAAYDTVWVPVPKIEIRFVGTLTVPEIYAKDNNNDYIYLDASRTSWGSSGKAGFTGVDLLIQKLRY